MWRFDITKDNLDVDEDDWNTAETTGARALLKIDLNDNWSITPGLMYQEAEVRGTWFDYEQYTGEEYEDLTLLSRLAGRRLVPGYADPGWKHRRPEPGLRGAYLDRDVESQYDYSGYAEYLDWYYSGRYENPADYCWYYSATGDCVDPSQYVLGDENFERLSHEIRLQSGQDNRFRWIAGLFYQRQEHYFDLRWSVDGLDPPRSIMKRFDQSFTAVVVIAGAFFCFGGCAEVQSRVWMLVSIQNAGLNFNSTASVKRLSPISTGLVDFHNRREMRGCRFSQ